MNDLLTYREAWQSVNRSMVYLPIPDYRFKECLSVYLFIMGQELTGEISEYNTRIIIQFFQGISAVKRWLGGDNLHIPHKALADMWWIHIVRPDALSSHLHVQNPVFETLFLI